MTIFAGAFSLDPRFPLPDELCNALRRSVSRFEGEVANEISDGNFFVTKVDIGAFGVPALHQDASGNATVIAGEPLIEDGEGDLSWNRAKDVALLHPALIDANWDGLAKCRGTFCGVHYNAAARSLALFVDKVGVRPLYLWVGPKYAVFATALRILESVDDVPKQFDVRGVTEIAAFSYPLGDRTAFLGIRTLKAGEVVHIAGGSVQQQSYWRWDGAVDTGTPYEQTVTKSYEEFIAAIKRRQRETPIAAAFLSGGLDSRAIVGGLDAIGSSVYTVNYAPDHTQDQVFATLVAEKLGTHHTQLETNAQNVAQGYRKNAVANWLETSFSQVNSSGQPAVLWSGDGGSVALGHVYLNRRIVAAATRGDTKEAITLFNKGIPKRIIQPHLRETLAELPVAGAQDELRAIDSNDPGRAFHLFLMFNDQRRHLTQHFEDLDVERIEFQLPFFDADFLETILRFPSEPYLEHRFYMDWLDKFPNGLATVPWQAYPGHVPCTLPSPPGLGYQWTGYYDKSMARQMTVATTRHGKQILAHARFPDQLLSRLTLNTVISLTWLGLRDYRYLINTAATYHRYWIKCNTPAPALAKSTGG